MKSFFITALAILLVCPTTPAFAQEWAKERLNKSPRHLDWVTVKYGGRDLKCFIAYPEKKERVTAVLIIHEIFGLSDWIRSLSDQLAENGFIAIAPDLLSDGKEGTAGYKDEDAVRKAVTSLPPDRVTSDLKAAADYAAKLPACNGKVVCAGFCWGGSQAFRFANDNNSLKATFVFYGRGPSEKSEVANINSPVYGFYAENDARVNATLPGTVELMKQTGKKFEPVTYKGAGHGFMRAGEAPDTNSDNSKSRNEAWKRFRALLNKI